MTTKKNNNRWLQIRLLSLFFCGLGHMFCGIVRKGIVLLMFYLFSLTAMVYFLFLSRGEFQYLIGIVSNGILLALWVYTQMDLNEIITQQKQITENEKKMRETPDNKAVRSEKKVLEKHNKGFPEKSCAFQTKEEHTSKDAHVKKSAVASTRKMHVDQLYREGRIAYLKKDLISSKDFFEKALRANKKDGDSIFQLGKVLLDMDDRDGAVKMFTRYLALKGPDRKWRSAAKKYLVELKE